jgi:hypothetical protein
LCERKIAIIKGSIGLWGGNGYNESTFMALLIDFCVAVVEVLRWLPRIALWKKRLSKRMIGIGSRTKCIHKFSGDWWRLSHSKTFSIPFSVLW